MVKYAMRPLILDLPPVDEEEEEPIVLESRRPRRE
jgi:hypothetical protein